MLWLLMALRFDAEAVEVGVPLAVELAAADVEADLADGAERNLCGLFEARVEEIDGEGLRVLLLGLKDHCRLAPRAFL